MTPTRAGDSNTSIAIGGLDYLSDNICNRRFRALHFDELYARVYNDHSEMFVLKFDPYSDCYFESEMPINFVELT